MNITGIIIKKLPLQSGTGKNGKEWMKKTFVLETMEQYPKHIAFDIFNNQDLIKDLNALPDNTTITIQFDIDAHEYNGRWYNQIRCWKYESNSGQSQPQQTAPVQPQQSRTAPASSDNNNNGSSDKKDDLPF